MGDEQGQGQGEGDDKRVPYWRFQEVVTERNEFKDRYSKLENEHKAAREKLSQWDQIAAERDQWKGKAETTAAQFGTDLRLAELGLDADARDVTRLLHGRLPEKERPELLDWVSGLRSDPTKAPRALQPYLAPRDAAKPEPKAEAPAAGAPAAAPAAQPAQGLPRSAPAAQPGGTPAAGGAVTAEAISAAIDKARRTGNWTEYNTMLGRSASWKPGQQ